MKLLRNESENRDAKAIIALVESILRFTENGEYKEFKTNQCYARMKELFRRYIAIG